MKEDFAAIKLLELEDRAGHIQDRYQRLERLLCTALDSIKNANVEDVEDCQALLESFSTHLKSQHSELISEIYNLRLIVSLQNRINQIEGDKE